jgi:hypothetical protein
MSYKKSTFRIDIYNNFKCFVFVSSSFDDVPKYVKERVGEVGKDCYGLMATSNEDWEGIIWIKKGERKTSLEVGTIAHESTHLAHYILNSIGKKADMEDDECLTYLVGYITSKVYETYSS